MKSKVNLAIGLSIIAVILSIIAVCIAAYRSPELGFDYQGVIVGILSLLVTLLIGWQIYNSLLWGKLGKEMDNKINGKLSELSHLEYKSINMVMLDMCKSHILGCLKYEEWYKMIIYYQNIIDFVCYLKDKDDAERVVTELYKLLENIEYFDDKELEEFSLLVDKTKQLSTFTASCFDFYMKAKLKILSCHETKT